MLGDRVQSTRIVEEVVEVAARFAAAAEELRVASDSIERFAADIQRRILKLRNGL